MKRALRSGFTLVELLTVIAIIALLAALILGLAGNAQKSAARNKAEAEITQLESFITDYQMKYGQVPLTVNARSSSVDLKPNSYVRAVSGGAKVISDGSLKACAFTAPLR